MSSQVDKEAQDVVGQLTTCLVHACAIPYPKLLLPLGSLFPHSLNWGWPNYLPRQEDAVKATLCKSGELRLKRPYTSSFCCLGMFLPLHAKAELRLLQDERSREGEMRYPT